MWFGKSRIVLRTYTNNTVVFPPLTRFEIWIRRWSLRFPSSNTCTDPHHSEMHLWCGPMMCCDEPTLGLTSHVTEIVRTLETSHFVQLHCTLDTEIGTTPITVLDQRMFRKEHGSKKFAETHLTKSKMFDTKINTQNLEKTEPMCKRHTRDGYMQERTHSNRAIIIGKSQKITEQCTVMWRGHTTQTANPVRGRVGISRKELAIQKMLKISYLSDLCVRVV